MLTTKTGSAIVRGAASQPELESEMKIKITKGTRIKGKGRAKAGKVLSVPGDVSEGDARFLVNTGQATMVAGTDEVTDAADDTRAESMAREDARADKEAKTVKKDQDEADTRARK